MTWAATDLTVRFGATTALEAIDIEFAPSTVTAIVGGDGAGKSTLLHCFAGLVDPAAGTVTRPGKHRLGFMPSTSGTWADLTVDENIAFVGTCYGMSPVAIKARRDALLERAGLTAAADRLGRNLSGGMRQKLGFLLTVLHEPEVLLLDEPSTGVDPVSRVDLWRLIADAAASGTAVAMATTYLDEAERASSVMVLDGGRTLARGTAAEITGDVPGAITVTSAPSDPGRSWRRGRRFREWHPDGSPGADVIRPDLEDAVITFMLRRDGATPPPAPSPTRPVASNHGVLARSIGAVRRFGDHVAVDDVTLDVAPGEIVGLIGANGAGKTTLIRLLLGLLRPTEGRVELFGGPPSRRQRSRLGYVSQGLGLYTDMTVAENLGFTATSFDCPVPDLPVELAGLDDHLVGDIGLGLQRQLAFVAALAHQPELLVLDEPTSGVDPLARARLWDIIHEQAEGGSGVLVTTHYMQEAEQCDRLAIMAAGRLVLSGTADDIVGDRTAVLVSARDWQAALNQLSSAGFAVTLDGTDVRVAGAGIEQVRSSLTGVELRSIDEARATLDEVMVGLAHAS